jgi:hypothetical protein
MNKLTRAVGRPVWAGALCLSLLAASPSAFAADAGNVATAKQILDITGGLKVFSPLVAGVVEQARLFYLQQNPAFAKDLNEIAAQMRNELEPRFSELSDAIAMQYADAFSEAEMKQILAFYQSPVGKKVIALQPKLTDQSMQFAQDWANKLSEQVTARMRDELVKRGHKL